MRRLNAPLLALVAVTLSSLDVNAGGLLVDIRSVDPTIVVELRYAERNNLSDTRFIHAEHALSPVQKSLPV